MDDNIKDAIDLLVHKAIDQLSVIKASTSLIATGGNGESLIDLKNASQRLKEIRSQIERKVADIEALVSRSKVSDKNLKE